jgi:hypothetical protein
VQEDAKATPGGPGMGRAAGRGPFLILNFKTLPLSITTLPFPITTLLFWNYDASILDEDASIVVVMSFLSPQIETLTVPFLLRSNFEILPKLEQVWGWRQ